ncbi:MAG: PD-(D/E)XK nuclease family protein [Rikenellaceae bacterium]
MKDNKFLKDCAQKLFELYGYDISELNIIMPTRRGASFLKLEIASLIKERPIWQPQFTSINALMSSVTSLREAERIKLIVELYKVYSRYHSETFDKFYFWGGVILSDFDTIDNYKVDAKLLYSNINDIKELEERFDYLSEEQKEMILRFWGTFRMGRDQSSSQKEFLKIWNTLYAIYSEFRKELEKQGIGYGGMIYRKAAEVLTKDSSIESLTDKRYVVIGFNALSECESALFDYLKEQCDSLFFWDFDNYYIDDKFQEAGMFIRQNIVRYGDAIRDCGGVLVQDGSGKFNKNDDDNKDNFVKEKNITIIDSPSETLACKYVGEILDSLSKAKGAPLSRETAVILTNESLLIPLLYSIPDSVENLNVTSGYPLKSTAAYHLINSLIKLHYSADIRDGKVRFYHKELFRLLSNYYIQSILTKEESEQFEKVRVDSIENMNIYIDEKKLTINPFSTLLFSTTSDIYLLCDKLEQIFKQIVALLPEDFPAEELEYINRALEVVIRLRNSMEGCDDIVTMNVFYSLLEKYLSSSSVTFEGEPLIGMQVMGILESRNLDFENVVILSLSEDNYPSINSLNSLIPSNLRYGYNLPTTANHEAMYSYYFYRLLERSKNVYLLYSSYAGESLSGEPSRYLHQLLLESPHKESIKRVNLNLDIISPQRDELVVEKDEKIADKLKQYLTGGRTLSASSLYDFVECPLRFYFSSIERIRPPFEISEEIDSATSGSILHRVLEVIYQKAKNCEGVQFLVALKSLLISEEFDRVLVDAFTERLNIDSSQFSGRVEAKIVEVRQLAQNIINYDIEKGQDFVLNQSECKINGKVSFKNCDGEDREVGFFGIIDRVDTLSDGRVRIIDYKSGKSNHKCKSLGDIMQPTASERSKPIFQTLLYSLLYRKMRGVDVRPSLYHARDISSENYTELITIGKEQIETFSSVEEQYTQNLEDVLSQLFNRDIAFYQTNNSDSCSYCLFNSICWSGKG